VEFAVDAAGRAGLRPHRSHDVLPLDTCLIADSRLLATGVLEQEWPGQRAVDAVAPSVGEPVLVPVPADPPRHGSAPSPDVVERVEAESFTGEFTVAARGFWQVHPGAAGTFVDTVLGMLRPREGETALDLYAGVGLFAAALGRAVGPGGRVVAVESDAAAVLAAEGNLAAYPWVLPLRARVDDAFGAPRQQRSRGPRGGRAAHRSRRPRRHPLLPPRADLVVLDPPRTGAGRDVVGEVAALGARAVAYVACDPAALARDASDLLAAGYAMTGLRAFDAFPMTHHVECVALFERQEP
jgi:tRNA/tmRNA/rRNA uracil-C5-methylase (TrmA/RlmC/RlmD family)